MTAQIIQFPNADQAPEAATPPPADTGGHSMADRVVMGFVILGTASYWGLHLYNLCMWLFSAP